MGLSYLPSVSVTMLLNLTSISVMILDFLFLGKRPSIRQLIGVSLVLAGAYLFFQDSLGGYNVSGVILTHVSGLGWAGYMVAGKRFFREQKLTPLGSSAFTMGFGTAIMGAAAYIIEGVSSIPPTGWVIILWLGVVNTAVAFLLWNHALESIDPFKLSVLQNTMLIQITVLSMIFLGERLAPVKYLFMGILFVGALIVQTEPTGEDSSLPRAGKARSSPRPRA